MKKQILAGALCLSLLLALLAGCAKTPPVVTSPEPSASVPASTEPSPIPIPPAPVRDLVNFGALKGNTGMGAAWLMSAPDTENVYNTTLAGANDEIVAGLANGSLDIAAMATNVAANLYNKTGGDVQMLAIVGLGLLYVAERGSSIRTMGDLAGKTIYAFGQGANPEFVLYHLLRENGLEPGEDVEVIWKTAEEVSALMLSGEAEICMLPAPAITGLLLKDDALRIALDMTEEWNEVDRYSQLTQSCIVVRTAFAEEHPEAVVAFLKDWAASIDYVNGNVDEAAALIAELGIVPSAAVAAAAIPQVNLVCITGVDMQSTVQGFFEVLYAADPASIGGAIPDDAFYHSGLLLTPTFTGS